MTDDLHASVCHNGPVTPDPSPSEPLPFAEVLSRAIADRGLSLERLRARLEAAGVPVSIATLSYWQSGRSTPTRSRSYHTLVELERVLNVEPGLLTGMTYSPEGRTLRELFEWQKVLPARELTEQIIEDLGIQTQGRLSRVISEDILTVGADRTESHQCTRTIWRAERSGAHRWAVVLDQDGDPAADTSGVPQITPVFGCRLGEVVEVPGRALVVAEMRALRPLTRGEMFTAEYKITWAPTTTPSFRVERSCPESIRGLGLGVRFHPDALPTRVESRVRPTADADADHTEVTPVPLAHHEAQIIRVDIKPALYSLHWSWE